MKSLRGKCMTLALIGAVLAPAAVANAGLQQDLRIGLNLFDYQFGFQRNVLGDGWDFQAVAFYGGQTYDMGVAQLTLGATSSSTVRLSAGYTTRGLPAANFSLLTDGAPLSYTLDANYGFQDFTATGDILVNVDTRINALGFYDQTFQISNRGTYETDGFGPTDSGTLDFDVGPIVVSGNVFVDIAAALTQPFFTATGTENPLAKLSQQATKITGLENVDDIVAKGNAGQTLSEEEVGKLVNNTILSAMIGSEPSADIFDSLMVPADLFEKGGDPTLANPMLTVPEPATVGLLALALAFFPPRRRGA